MPTASLQPAPRLHYFPAVRLPPLAVPITLGCLFATLPLAAQQDATLPVPAEALAGQEVAVMPLTLVATDPAFLSDTLFAPYRDRRTTLTWADSVIGDAFVGRAPEVRWVLPPELLPLLPPAFLPPPPAPAEPFWEGSPLDLETVVVRASLTWCAWARAFARSRRLFVVPPPFAQRTISASNSMSK